MKVMYRSFLIILAGLTFSCATIINGPSQDVGFASDPSGAKVMVDGDSLGLTPLRVSLARKNTHMVRIEADGYEPYEAKISRKMDSWIWGNIFLGTVGLAGAAVDIRSGALYELTPKRIQVRLVDGTVVQKFDKSMWNMPALNMGRIAGELVAGMAGGAAGAFGVYTLMDALIGEGLWLLNPASGGEAGWLIGNALGVYLVGNLGNETGSFIQTVRGSVAGLVVGTVALALPLYPLMFIYMNNPDFWPTYAKIVMYVMPTSLSIGATIGFNSTRRYKNPPTDTGLINFQDRQMSLAVPRVYIRPNPFIRGELVQTIDLVKVRF
ncbi:MAG: PEGA domain-containing protein [Methanomassiliicoccales archaeon]|nr:MAG: PEGA domain-containing protein [Methanomassiliicoccales archaeon]